jgi:hypothetical protein
MFLLSLCFQHCELAIASTIKIACGPDGFGAFGAATPMTITYTGEATGTLTVTSKDIELRLPAQKSSRTSSNGGETVTATVIDGIGETDALMPDPGALQACVVQSVPPEFKDDPDLMYSTAQSCASKVALGPAPVRIKAAVSVGIIPSPSGASADIIVEMKRSYLEVPPHPGGPISLDTFPRDCR